MSNISAGYKVHATSEDAQRLVQASGPLDYWLTLALASQGRLRALGRKGATISRLTWLIKPAIPKHSRGQNLSRLSSRAPQARLTGRYE